MSTTSAISIIIIWRTYIAASQTDHGIEEDLGNPALNKMWLVELLSENDDDGSSHYKSPYGGNQAGHGRLAAHWCAGIACEVYGKRARRREESDVVDELRIMSADSWTVIGHFRSTCAQCRPKRSTSMVDDREEV